MIPVHNVFDIRLYRILGDADGTHATCIAHVVDELLLHTVLV